MKYLAIVLVVVTGISGCAKIQELMLMEKPRFSVLTPEQPVREVPVKAEAAPPPVVLPLVSWMDKYGMASEFTSDERQARLVTIDALTKDAVSAADQQTLAMEQATLLGVPDESYKHWLKAREILQMLSKQTVNSEIEQYRLWLSEELERRLQYYQKVSRLNAKIASLEKNQESLQAEVAQLKEQIDALTNIEQNLTEKKATQTEP